MFFVAARGQRQNSAATCLQSEAKCWFACAKEPWPLQFGGAPATVLILEKGELDPTVAIKPRRAQFEGFSLRLREPLFSFLRSRRLRDS